MTYDPNIPQPTDILSASQQDILDNFTVANNVMGVNHYPFSDTSGKQGNHKTVIFSGIPVPPTPLLTDSAVYPASDPNDLSTRTQLYFKNSTSTVQITNRFKSAVANDGYVMVNGGLIFMWGFVATPPIGQTQVLFPTITNYNYGGNGFPNSVFNIQLTIQKNDSTVRQVYVDNSQTIDNTQFTFITGSSNINGVYWFAVGN